MTAGTRGALLAALLAGILAACDSTGILLGSADAFSDGAPAGRCGNGRVEPGETCDDGNVEDCDGCSSACRSETALYVDRSTPGVSVPLESSPCLTCPFTVEAWFRVDTPGATVPIVYQEGLLEFNVDETGMYFVTSRGGAGMGLMEELTYGVWHHAAAMCFWNDDAGMWMYVAYVDGLSFGAISGIGPHVTECDRPLLIGHAVAGYTDPLPPSIAVIDDVRLSNQALYEFGGDDFPAERDLPVRSDTVALYDFDGVVDGLVPDASGHGHDAVIEHGTLVPDGCHLP